MENEFNNETFNLSKEEMIEKNEILKKDYESLIIKNEEEMFKNPINQ